MAQQVSCGQLMAGVQVLARFLMVVDVGMCVVLAGRQVNEVLIT